MDLHLNGKRALVSASSGGIGLAIARSLAREGARVVVNGRTVERVEQALTTIRQAVPNAELTPLVANLGTRDGVETAIREVPEVDILVNNLGIYQPKPFSEISDEEWLHFFEVNVLSGVRLSRHYLPGMLGRNWGRILFISSESGIATPAEMIHYGVTKTAQLAVSRGLAELTAGTNVTVNSVLPGPTRSEGVEDFIKANAEAQGKTPADIERDFFTSLRPSSLIKRFASVDEVAAMVTYVSSPLASATNGSALRVEGGVVRSII
jgi:NAD(P)-dependent dehydrogenase (short-subunit alcohol dehydrogenase family)